MEQNSRKARPLKKTSQPSGTPHSKKTKAQLIEELTALEQRVSARNPDMVSPNRNIVINPDTLFYASFNASTNLMAVTRVNDGRHSDVNPAWQEAFGFTREEAIGKTSLELGVWHPPEQRDAILGILGKEGIVRDYRATMRAKDGTLHECLVTMIPIEADDEEYLLFSAYDISVLNTLQDELRQFERRHEIANRQAKVAFWRWSFADEKLTDWSDYYAEINDYDGAAAMTYDEMLAYVHPDERETVLWAYQEADKNRTGFDIEYRRYNNDGTLRWIREYAEIEYDQSGVAVAHVGFDQDITETRQAQEALQHAYDDLEKHVQDRTRKLNNEIEQRREITRRLRDSEAQYAQAERIANIHNWTSNATFDAALSYSETAEAMLKIPIKELIGDHSRFYSHVHPNDIPHLEKVFADIRKNPRPYEVQYRFCPPDGSTIHLLEAGEPVYDEKGTLLMFRGTTQDITREKQTQQALVESESRYRTIVETAADAIITIDEDGIIESFNHSAELAFGYQESEALGKNVNHLMPEPFASNHDTYLKNYIATGAAKIIGIGREVEGLRKDGSTFPMLLSVSEVESTGKRIFTGIVRDITEYKEAEQHALAAKEEAERANAAKTEFLAHMSHEFRTPLNAIIGFSETIANKTFGEIGHPKYVDYIGDIMNSGHLLLHIVNDILDISKVEAGEMTLHQSIFSPTDVIQESITTARGISDEAGAMSIELIDDAPAFNLLADIRIFKQIMLNLLTNALKFTPADGQISITTSKNEDDTFLVKIRDTGCGIAEEDLGLVLEPFGQARSSAQTAHKGTGLGLSLSKILTELHGGTLTIESELDKGTTITLLFPDAHHANG